MWLMEGNPKGLQSSSQTIISREVFSWNSVVVFAVAGRGSGSWQRNNVWNFSSKNEMHKPLQREGNVLNSHGRKTVQGWVIPEGSLLGIKWEKQGWEQGAGKGEGVSNSPEAGKDGRAE